jgi:hypothetical protein
MRKKINTDKFIGILGSDIKKEIVKINTDKDISVSQVVGNNEDAVYLIKNENGSYKLLGELDEYLEEWYLNNTILDVLSGQYIADKE